MPTRRHFANQAPQQTLNAAITSSAATCVINGSFAGWPTQFPFFASLDFGTASAEIVSVTGITGATASILRGQDGTAQVSHAAGATLDHVIVALDADEANAHTSSNSGVHGVSGNVVGTSDAQTLTNKTLASPAFTGTVPGTLAGTNATWSGTFSGVSSTWSGTVSSSFVPTSFTNEAAASAAFGGAPATGTVVYLTAPTAANTSAGVFVYTGTAWKSLVQFYSGDTGWVNITVNNGFSGNSPQARLKNGVIYTRGSFGTTGITTVNTSYAGVGVFPASIPFIPVTQVYAAAAGNANASCVIVFNSTGTIDVRTNATLGTSYQLGMSYLQD